MARAGRRVSPLVYRIAVRVLGTGGDADDAGQEVLVRVYRSFRTFDPTRPLSPWVARVTYNVCLQLLARRRRPGGPGDDAEAVELLPDALGESPETFAARVEAGDLVGAALERLTPEDRVLVTLTYQDGMSNSEVAEAMDMPVGTVKMRLFRARAKLRKVLAPVLRRGGRR